MGLLRAKMMTFVLCLLIMHCQGFLLDTGKGQISSSGQFLSESEFLEAKKLLNQEINELRRDTDKTIAFLTTQLQNKFNNLEQKLANVDNNGNGTNQNNMSTNEYRALEQKLNEVVNDNADLKRENMIMKNEMAAMRNALSALNNASTEHSRKIQDLQNLRSIKPLLEVSVLQKSVKYNSDSIQFLSMHEQARRQDFLALYNMTIDSNRRLTELETNTSGQILQHQTYMNNQLMNLQTTYNASLKGTKEAMNGEKVVLMAQATSITSNIIQFNDVKFSFGINNLSTFKNSGKFVCENNGTYLVSVSLSIKPTDSDAAFCIQHNGATYSCTESPHINNLHSYSTTIVMDLKKNDNVWVIHGKNVESGRWSHFMIMKIY